MKVLIVEDNPIDAQALIDLLEGSGFDRDELVQADRLAGVAEYRDTGVELVLLDLSLPDGSGLESIRAVQAKLTPVPIVVLTTDEDSETSLRMLRGGAQDYLVKGHFDRDTLLRSMRYAIERARAEELRQRLYHADRLAVVGQLAAGVAHEIANPSSFVQGNLLLAQRRLQALSYDAAALAAELEHGEDRAGYVQRARAMVGQLDEARRTIEQGLSGVARISNVARDMQGYSRVEREPLEAVQLNDIVNSTCKLANSLVRHRAQLITELGDVPKVFGDRSGLEQVVTNLVVNASHAIPEGDASAHRIVVSTQFTDEGIVLAVEDTGPGVPEAVRQRIFEPFFTTKARGVGTGLGLSIALEIARSHGGTLRHRDAAIGGARFELVLPAVRTVPPPPSAISKGARSGVRARVLLVDDEPGIRAVYRELLSTHHDMTVAANGREALELIAREPAFDVILCDLMMPDMDGRELYEQLREQAPALVPRVVFCSGGIVTERSRSFVASIPNRLLEKPISVDMLRLTIEEIAADNADHG
ncbi:MAG TPA: response regulator [Polyangiales bacterium]